MEQGHILIADPSVFGDQYFHRSIVLIAEKRSSGILGFILNKPLAYNVNEIIPEITSDHRLYYGGPVKEDNLFMFHNAGDLVTGSNKINDKLFWGGDIDEVIKLVKEGILTKNNIRFFLGYSGWSNNQLEEEVNSNSWIVIKNPLKDKILSIDPETLWKNQLRALGGKYLIWSNTPENPFQN